MTRGPGFPNGLRICTLGNFSVHWGEKNLTGCAGRSYRLWELFKFFLTYRGKGVLPEVILETIWPDREYSDPKGAVRTLVYRLRHLLEEECPGGQGRVADLVLFEQGCYRWNTDLDYWLDLDEPERLYRLGQQLTATDPLEAIAIFKEAIGLYRGEYLPECAYSEWALPVRSYYRRLYLQLVLETGQLLTALGCSEEVIALCEDALRLEPLEEGLHVCLLEALLVSGRTERARSHYQQITATLYRELGVKPSPALQQIYRLLQVQRGQVDLDLGLIQAGLQQRAAAPGAFLCDKEVFWDLYSLEQRWGERTGQSVVLGLLTITGLDYHLPPPGVLKNAMDRLEMAVLESLRKGDVVARWNEAQLLIMLPGSDVKQARGVLDRLEARFWEDGEERQVVLRSSFQALQLLD